MRRKRDMYFAPLVSQFLPCSASPGTLVTFPPLPNEEMTKQCETLNHRLWCAVRPEWEGTGLGHAEFSRPSESTMGQERLNGLRPCINEY